MRCSTTFKGISITEEAGYIISALEDCGYEAYAVGGCVRDSLLGNTPEDWDICTSAPPLRTMEVFAGRQIIETGLRHGTVTLVLGGKPFEITTYRTDGEYTDNRRPDTVKFVRSLKEDLSRRDFTVNAMAYNPRRGIADYFGGADDLRSKTIRAVGNAPERFQEDALRIIRALRFASVLDFSIEPRTSDAIHGNRELLENIASERISRELNKLIAGKNAVPILREYADVSCVIIPEIKKMAGFKQNNPHHHLDVWEHTLASVEAAPADVILRMAMLMHDIGKPLCYTEKDGTGHFYGHSKISAGMAENILKRLKYDNAAVSAVTTLILHHGSEIQEKHIKRWLNKLGEDGLRRLLEVKRADTMGKPEKYRHEGLNGIDALSLALDEIIEQRQCFSLKDLAVDGRDIMATGVPEGAEVGALLNRLLGMVIDGNAQNDKAVLLDIAEKLKRAE